MADHAPLSQGLRSHLGAGVEDVERTDVDECEGLLVRIAEPLELGETHGEWRLTALEPGPQRVAGQQALGPAPGLGATTGAGPATDANLLLLGSLGRLQDRKSTRLNSS